MLDNVANAEKNTRDEMAVRLALELNGFYKPGMCVDDLLNHIRQFTTDESLLVQASMYWLTATQEVIKEREENGSG